MYDLWVDHLFDLYIRQSKSGTRSAHPDFAETPRRVKDAFGELLYGHTRMGQLELDDLFDKTFPIAQAEMVSILGVKASGICPHHLLPVLYSVDFAYIPRACVIGLSKIPRTIKILAARAVLQEQLTTDIADTFFKRLESRGVAGCARLVDHHKDLKWPASPNVLTYIGSRITAEDPLSHVVCYFSLHRLQPP